jgi:hypothetical protein
MREQWACPDLGLKKPDGLYNPIPGCVSYEFDECPAYYLRTVDEERPAIHLIDGVTHAAHPVSEWAFEVESGARLVDSLSPKGRDAVHLYVSEKAARDRYAKTLERVKR